MVAAPPSSEDTVRDAPFRHVGADSLSRTKDLAADQPHRRATQNPGLEGQCLKGDKLRNLANCDATSFSPLSPRLNRGHKTAQ